MSAGASFYSMRPNKFVDRRLFVAMLQELRRLYPIDSYRYTGFGSFAFDDFKLVHEGIGIDDLVSIEADPFVCRRAEYNRPYACIQIKQMTMGKYLDEMEPAEHGDVVWLDYVDRTELGDQLRELSQLVSILGPGSVFKITLSAQPYGPVDAARVSQSQENLPEVKRHALDEKEGWIADEFLPKRENSYLEYMSRNRFPDYLVEALRNAVYVGLEQTDTSLIELGATVYADTTQMLTATGLVVGEWEEKKIRDSLERPVGRDAKRKNGRQLSSLTLCWDKRMRLCMPQLTSKEYLELMSLMPIGREIDELLAEDGWVPRCFLPEPKGEARESLACLLENYRFYPQFRYVSL